MSNNLGVFTGAVVSDVEGNVNKFGDWTGNTAFFEDECSPLHDAPEIDLTAGDPFKVRKIGLKELVGIWHSPNVLAEFGQDCLIIAGDKVLISLTPREVLLYDAPEDDRIDFMNEFFPDVIDGNDPYGNTIEDKGLTNENNPLGLFTRGPLPGEEQYYNQYLKDHNGQDPGEPQQEERNKPYWDSRLLTHVRASLLGVTAVISEFCGRCNGAHNCEPYQNAVWLLDGNDPKTFWQQEFGCDQDNFDQIDPDDPLQFPPGLYQ